MDASVAQQSVGAHFEQWGLIHLCWPVTVEFCAELSSKYGKMHKVPRLQIP